MYQFLRFVVKQIILVSQTLQNMHSDSRQSTEFNISYQLFESFHFLLKSIPNTSYMLALFLLNKTPDCFLVNNFGNIRKREIVTTLYIGFPLKSVHTCRKVVI